MLRPFPAALHLLAWLATVANSADSIGPGLVLSFPQAQQEQRFVYFDPKSHLHVLLTNRSDRPQRVWEASNSWGHYALSFNITDASGKSWNVSRPETAFLKNAPGFVTIAPGDTVVMDVYFGDREKWDGFPLKKGQENAVHIRALLEVAPSAEATEFSVWVGHIESTVVAATFVR